MRAHYDANVSYYVDKAVLRNAEYLARNRKWATDYLLRNPCVDCGERDLRCLTFDHVRGVKKGNVSNMLRAAVSLQAIIDEIAKCEVRCSNCHMKKTARDFGWWSHAYMESTDA